MKSAKDMMNLVRKCFKANENSRRSQQRQANRFGSPEVMEERLLLTVDLQDALYNGLVVDEIGERTRVESYFVHFDAAQNTTSLRLETGATAVAESQFIENGYNLTFNDGKTLQEAADLFGGLSGFDYLHPNVAREQVLRAIPNDPLYVEQWHLSNTGQGGGVAGIDINVESVWDNYTGQGVVIGIVDDGLEVGHEDLQGNVNTSIDFDFNDNDADPSPGAFDFHGTAVGGLASAVGNNGTGVSGAAWDAELVGLRLISAPTTDQQQAAALTHEFDTIDIFNNSWGPADNGRVSSIGPEVVAALELSATAGRNGLGNIHTWAGGNGGDFTNDDVNYDPYANSRFTLAVGALSNNGVRAQYSDVGAALFLVAPSGDSGGTGTLDLSTTDITGANGYDASNYTDTFNGTSASTPVVSGVIALMLEANPNLTYRDVSDILAHTSVRVDAGNGGWTQNGAGLWVNHEYGFGAIDAAAAVDAALNHVPLGPEQTFSTGTISVAQAIPDAGGGSVQRQVNVSASDAIDSLEYVEIVLDASHTFTGDLEIVLTSPAGTRSVLAESRFEDPGNGYQNHVFSTVRSWDESSQGTWTLTITDGQTADTGVWNSFELRFYGTNDVLATIVETGTDTRVSDFGIVDSFDVVLPSQPVSDVVLTVSSSDLTEVTTSTNQLTFTPANWNVRQTVNLTGVSDLIPDGNQLSNVFISDGVESVSVRVTSVDDDGTVPGPPVITSPDAFPDNNTPIFAWTPGVRSNRFQIVVTNLQTGLVVQQATNIVATTFAFATPFPDGLYQVTVQAFNTIGQAGALSEPLIFNIGDPVVPGQPTITSPTTGSVLNINQPTIQWQSVTAAFEYELYFLTNGEVTRVRTAGVDVGGGLLEYAVPSPLDEGVTSVWIRAFNFFGDAGVWSDVSRFTVDAFGAPLTPRLTAPLLDVTSNAFPIFEWTGGGPSATAYQLWVAELRDGTGTPQVPAIYDRVIHVTNHTETSYQHFLPLGERNHRAWVRSFNAAGEASRWSAFEEFTISIPDPAVPVLTPIVNTQDTTPRFSWTTGGDAYTPGTTFRLWVNNLSTGENRVIDQSGITDNSFTPVEPLEQGRHAVWVRATNAAGEDGPWSERAIVNIDVLAPGRPVVDGPVAEPDAESTDVLNEFPEFSWTSVFNGSSYQLWVNHDDTGTSQIINQSGIKGTTFVPDFALPQGNLTAWVRARNSAGEVGEWSVPFKFFLDVPAPTKPVVVAPVANPVGVVIDPTPTIQWETAVAATSYDLQLVDLVTNEFLVNTTGLTELSYTVPFELQERQYQVRVRGVNSIGETSEWSDFYEFRIDEPNATTPVALGPTGTIRENDLVFTWRHSPDSIRYEILVRDLVRQENIVLRADTFDVDTVQNIASFEHSLSNSTFRFWVRAFNTQGTASGWSNSISFIVDVPLASLEDTVGDDEGLLTSLRFLTHETPATQASTASVAQYQEVPAEQSEQPVSAEDVSAIEAVMAEIADPEFMSPIGPGKVDDSDRKVLL